ncbi:MAG: heavy-metal-associated domain-containing protein [candidate division KSB1 bacterium]|nr:heavy-metal-associated domain-containing protein [candidate division KSB1 bacterium]MDZ7275585.1 heavy-metal-associated domain-containing protein [candidate division KSB1 bacterium]MDZ7284724.1 heavy-metal-associated domain-containing protein [candidate division KSB1 bacterium]MDZ7297857.1 heavy-metal-associated domain-containing protein [candidate division KSB1 bacterium]MDZ7348722.1 heavy-metal-associated domain-containing protein [candidate division KSB1 bacterium]
MKKFIFAGVAIPAMIFAGFLLLPQQGVVQSAVIPVSGMTCEGCAAKITQALEKLNGVKAVAVSLAKRQASVQFDAAVISEAAIAAAITKLGYQIGTAGAGTPPAGCESEGKEASGGCCTAKARPSST